MIAVARDAVLVAAGVLAGVVGTAGGITSLISYPALLWVGVPALQATIANTVAIVACWPGSAAASRPELRDRGPWLRRWIPVAAAASTAGSVLLLVTPAGVFSRVVPFLIAAGSLALLLQPRITAGSGETTRGGRRWILPGAMAVLSVYNGYFGAGTGVLLLSLMLLTVDSQLARANALKNMLVGASSIAAAVTFAVLAKVDWTVVAPLAAGMLAGSVIGPRIARRMPPGLLRWLVALTGLGFAARLWLTAG